MNKMIFQQYFLHLLYVKKWIVFTNKCVYIYIIINKNKTTLATGSYECIILNLLEIKMY